MHNDLHAPPVSGPIPHDVAHELADTACVAGEYAVALELLERAERNGALGFHASARTANRILNVKARLKRLGDGPVTPGEMDVALDELWACASTVHGLPWHEGERPARSATLANACRQYLAAYAATSTPSATEQSA